MLDEQMPCLFMTPSPTLGKNSVSKHHISQPQFCKQESSRFFCWLRLFLGWHHATAAWCVKRQDIFAGMDFVLRGGGSSLFTSEGGQAVNQDINCPGRTIKHREYFHLAKGIALMVIEGRGSPCTGCGLGWALGEDLKHQKCLFFHPCTTVPWIWINEWRGRTFFSISSICFHPSCDVSTPFGNIKYLKFSVHPQSLNPIPAEGHWLLYHERVEIWWRHLRQMA